jgi:3-oxoacyl-[acyl-carrier protein] reductase
VAVSADVTKPPDIARMVETATVAFGHVDVLVNNAGTLIGMPTNRLTEGQRDHLMAVSLKALVLVSQAALPSMVRAGREQSPTSPPSRCGR